MVKPTNKKKPTAKTKATKTVKKASSQKPTNKVETTGHSWDGIEELNTPLPRWWLWIFLLTIIFSAIYMYFFPSLPKTDGSFTKGSLGWTQYNQLEKEQKESALSQAALQKKIAETPINQIMEDDNLYAFAFSNGKSAFGLHCAQCHNTGGTGTKGYPSLVDNEWLWGGKAEDILYTITHGIRNETDENARSGDMPAFGEILSKDELFAVESYIRVLSKRVQSSMVFDEGKEVFLNNCASCHGENGKGNHELGAPDLTNAIWLYGGSPEDMGATIRHGRNGIMPAWGGKLDNATIKALTVYIKSLSGGE